MTHRRRWDDVRADAVSRLSRLRRFQIGLLVGQLQESLRASFADADRLHRENVMLRHRLRVRDVATKELTVTCGCCEGAGEHSVRLAVDDYETTSCDKCSGTGKLAACDCCDGLGEREGGVCRECDGYGWVDSGTTCDAAAVLSNVVPFKAARDFR